MAAKKTAEKTRPRKASKNSAPGPERGPAAKAGKPSAKASSGVKRGTDDRPTGKPAAPPKKRAGVPPANAKVSGPKSAKLEAAPKSAKLEAAPKSAKLEAAPKSAKATAPKPERGAPPPGKPSFTETMKRAAAKVAQVAASAALKVLDPDSGRPAPSFELTDQTGELVTSDSLAGKPYLLYFYPKDDTPGCTKEACDIRDNFGRFGKQGLRVLGVSPDSAQSHTKFIQKYGLPFTLLSDPDKSLATAYGVWAEKSNYGKKYMGIVRSSFLVSADGVIKKAYRGVKVDGHVDAVLQDAKAML